MLKLFWIYYGGTFHVVRAASLRRAAEIVVGNVNDRKAIEHAMGSERSGELTCDGEEGIIQEHY
jgi:hypothetical protein